MKNETLNFDTPETGRHLPIEGRPFALVMAEIYKEQGHVRIVR
jgi:hypothetical protein